MGRSEGPWSRLLTTRFPPTPPIPTHAHTLPPGRPHHAACRVRGLEEQQVQQPLVLRELCAGTFFRVSVVVSAANRMHICWPQKHKTRNTNTRYDNFGCRRGRCGGRRTCASSWWRSWIGTSWTWCRVSGVPVGTGMHGCRTWASPSMAFPDTPPSPPSIRIHVCSGEVLPEDPEGNLLWLLLPRRTQGCSGGVQDGCVARGVWRRLACGGAAGGWVGGWVREQERGHRAGTSSVWMGWMGVGACARRQNKLGPGWAALVAGGGGLAGWAAARSTKHAVCHACISSPSAVPGHP